MQDFLLSLVPDKGHGIAQVLVAAADEDVLEFWAKIVE